MGERRLQRRAAMRMLSFVIVGAFGFLGVSPSFAEQPLLGMRGLAMRTAVVRFAALADQEESSPRSFGQPEAAPYPVVPSHLHRSENSFQPAVDRPVHLPRAPSGTVAPSPPPLASFAALGDDNTRIPPDTHGAVGLDHLMVTLNTQMRVQRRDGTPISTVSLLNFWSSLGVTFVFDPRVLFDPFHNRWITTAAAQRVSSDSSLLIGVSRGSDPTGVWNLYRVDADAANANWVDYPNVGFNKDWIVVSANMPVINSGGFRVNIWAFDKADLYSGGAGSFTLFDFSSGNTLAPAVTHDDSEPAEYLVEQRALLGTLLVHTITGSVGSEVLTPVVSRPSVPQRWARRAPDFGADFAPQLGSTEKIQTNDATIQNLVYRNGSLWCTHTVFLPDDVPTRSSVQWWQFSPSGVVEQFGRIDDPTGERSYAFPSLAVNQRSEVLIGYTRFSATQYASANYAYRAPTDPPNTLRADTVLKAGEAPYFKPGNGRNRWGDYSHTVVDPLTDTDMWTIQSYAAAPSGGFDRWGTWWGKVRATAATRRVRKNRVVSIRPNNPDGRIVMKVERLDLVCNSTGKKCTFADDCRICMGGGNDGQACLIDSNCSGGICEISGETCDERSPPVMLGWVSDPIPPNPASNAPPGIVTAIVQTTMPAPRVWSEPVVHIGDCEIAPAQSYGISASADGKVFSPPLRVGTSDVWGDLVGSIEGGAITPPNGILNVNDLSALLAFFEGRTLGDPELVVTTLDLTPETPTFFINATDLQEWLRVFGGASYPPSSFRNQGAPENCSSADCETNADCHDGRFCNGAETCVARACQAGSNPCPGQGCDEVNDRCLSGGSAQLEAGSVSVGGSDLTVHLTNAYVSAVVVCTTQYKSNTVPVVPRVSRVTSTSFDVRLENPSGAQVEVENVSFLVVEEGAWTIDGVRIEAQSYLSTVTDEDDSWVAQAQSYRQAYTTPVVLGQVMTTNDPLWSTFWCQGDARSDPPSAGFLRTGKTVCEDTNTSRANETVGFIVFEAGHGTIGGVEFEAALGADIVEGVTNSPPYNYTFNTAFSQAPKIALGSLAGMSGVNGGWAQIHGATLATTTTLFLSIDEDQIADSERGHTTERVGYVAFESAVVFPAAAQCITAADCDDGVFCNGDETCASGSCQPGTPPTCDDGVACTDDFCNVGADSCENVANDAHCSNGLFCDGSEACDSALDCRAGSDPCPGQACDEVADQCSSGPPARLESGSVSVAAAPVTVNLTNTYASAVVVCSVAYNNNTTPVVTRVNNVTGRSFDVRLQNPSGGAVAAENVNCLVVEEGTWTIDGVKIEAQRYLSMRTDETSSWQGEDQNYGQAYVNPVIVGQVMTTNDPEWSVFWDQGSSRTTPPSASVLLTGKTVCQDTITARADETIGFIVIEAGHGTIGGVAYEAAVGADSVEGVTNNPPYSYTFDVAFDSAPRIAVVTQAAMDGGDGGWAQVHGPTFTTPTTLFLSIDEDQIRDDERDHTTEQVGYIVFESPVVFPPAR